MSENRQKSVYVYHFVMNGIKKHIMLTRRNNVKRDQTSSNVPRNERMYVDRTFEFNIGAFLHVWISRK